MDTVAVNFNVGTHTYIKFVCLLAIYAVRATYECAMFCC
jgi:hypothetical protein